MSKLIDLTGKTFGRLILFQYEEKYKYWCICTHGLEDSSKWSLVDYPIRSNTISGKKKTTKSCGCLKNTIVSFKSKDKFQIKRLQEIGKTYNGCEILETWVENYDGSRTFSKIKCWCGNIFVSLLKSIKSGNKKSCGCLKNIFNLKERIVVLNSIAYIKNVNTVYNNCKILDIFIKNNAKKYIAEVLCHCGQIFTTELNRIKSGHTKSCGCSNRTYIQNLLDFYEKNGYFPGYIYQIKNKMTGALYIGKTNWLEKRWEQHVNEFQKEKHGNKLMQKDYNQYGIDIFEFSILKEFKFKKRLDAINQLLNIEKLFIENMKPIYNVTHAKNFTNIIAQNENWILNEHKTK